MLPVYLSKALAFVVRSKLIVAPHFSSIDVLTENLVETLKINKSELNFININSNLDIAEKVELGKNEFFVDESLFNEVRNLNQDSFIYSDYSYQNLLWNLEIAGPVAFLAVNDQKLLYELGCSYFTRLFKQRSLSGSLYFTGLASSVFTAEQLLGLVSDCYSGEGMVKIYTSNLAGKQVTESAKLVASLFFGSGKAEISVDFGFDEDHQINISRAERVRINLGGKTTKISVKTSAKVYDFEVEEGEVGFFVDLRDKPLNSINLVKNKIPVFK